MTAHDLIAAITILVVIYTALRDLFRVRKPPTTPGSPPATRPVIPPGAPTPIGGFPPPAGQRPPAPNRQPTAGSTGRGQAASSSTGHAQPVQQSRAGQWGARTFKKAQLPSGPPASQAPMSDVALDFREQQQRSDEEFAEAAKQAEMDSANAGEQAVRQRDNNGSNSGRPGGRSFSQNPMLDAIILAQAIGPPHSMRRIR